MIIVRVQTKHVEAVGHLQAPRASAGGGAVGGHNSECDMEAAELEANASTQSVKPGSRKESLSPPKLLGAAAAIARSLSKSGQRQQIYPP